MRFSVIGVLLLALAGALANAHRPPDGAQAPVPIADAEPGVTAQVRALLQQCVDGSLTAASLTDKASAALLPGQVRQWADTLPRLGALGSLQLLRRSVDGEDRQYQYRAVFAHGAVLLDITFNKGGRVNVLRIRPEAL